MKKMISTLALLASWSVLMAAKLPGDLQDIATVAPTIQVALVYATPHNFTHQKVYTYTHCYLLPEVAQQLALVQKELVAHCLGLKVWDCFRPLAAQRKFWEILPDERYVSNPNKGGLHTRGTAVDLTLVDAKGKELLMPTKFDDFSAAAHRNNRKVDPAFLARLDLLEKTMKKHHFIGLSTEWWHFDYETWPQHPPLEVDLKLLK